MFMRGLAIFLAIFFHAAILLFGGIFFLHKHEDFHNLQVVDLLKDEDVKKDEKKDEPKPEEIKQDEDQAPDAAKEMEKIEMAAPPGDPQLSAMSLGDMDALLNGQPGDASFGGGMDFQSGSLTGTRKGGDGGSSVDDAFSLAEIDQKPQAIYQASPQYPSEMRGKKVEGLVTLIFIVDASGKVSNPKIEHSSNPVFEKPALEAVRKWKFEPAVKGGERVACKIRVPIRFPPS
ncbi:MAG TPA: energy transducer TonB [Phycisphaerales bacterium]|nr:energy transducer TonB [Phycisphaerales bacterium]